MTLSPPVAVWLGAPAEGAATGTPGNPVSASSGKAGTTVPLARNAPV
ncbi:Uncharacterised protein [Mycobacteroides abscessus subsp. abscessus]|nr:Uncharacterised protein [Mycobacteroides abscessus subsp. abscessus]